jgi:CBS domain-containing protein
VTRAPDTVAELMTTDVATVAPTDTVRDALRAMLERDIGSVVVVEDGAPVGVFTERDLSRRILDDPHLPERQLGDQMAAPVEMIAPSAEIIAAFEHMNSRNVRRLPVVDGDGLLVGIVTERDLLRWVGEVANE